jgi:hypothetical protein
MVADSRGRKKAHVVAGARGGSALVMQRESQTEVEAAGKLIKRGRSSRSRLCHPQATAGPRGAASTGVSSRRKRQARGLDRSR